MGYCARLSALEEHHRFLNSERAHTIQKLLSEAALLLKGLQPKAASITPLPLNLLSFSVVASLSLPVTLQRSLAYPHTDYWSFVSRLHLVRADSVCIGKGALISATCGKH